MRELYISKKVITLILHCEIFVGSHWKFIVLKKIACSAEVDEIRVDEKCCNCLWDMFFFKV